MPKERQGTGEGEDEGEAKSLICSLVGAFLPLSRDIASLWCQDCFGPPLPTQLSVAATARVIWLCACVRYWPDRGLAFECVTSFFVVVNLHFWCPNSASVLSS